MGFHMFISVMLLTCLFSIHFSFHMIIQVEPELFNCKNRMHRSAEPEFHSRCTINITCSDTQIRLQLCFMHKSLLRSILLMHMQ